MGFLDELVHDVLEPGGTSRLAHGRGDDPDRDVSAEELAAVRREVRELRATVAVLAQLLYEADAFARVDRESFRRRLAQAVREARYQESEAEDARAEQATRSREDDGGPAVVQSAYRGAMPGVGGRGCRICGKPLLDDDPELTLPTRGPVCMVCFQRGE